MRNYIRWMRFVRRIRAQLPSFNPLTGQAIHWRVELKTRRRFNPISGMPTQIGLSTLRVRQETPSLIPADDKVYEFNRFTGRAIAVKNAVWR